MLANFVVIKFLKFLFREIRFYGPILGSLEKNIRGLQHKICLISFLCPYISKFCWKVKLD